MKFIGKGLHYLSLSPKEDQNHIVEKVFYVFNIPIFLKTKLNKKKKYNRDIIFALKMHSELILRGTPVLGYAITTKDNIYVGDVPWVWRTVGELDLINLKRSSDKIKYINMGFSKKYNHWFAWTSDHDLYRFAKGDVIFLRNGQQIEIQNEKEAEVIAELYINQLLKKKGEL